MKHPITLVLISISFLFSFVGKEEKPIPITDNAIIHHSPIFKTKVSHPKPIGMINGNLYVGEYSKGKYVIHEFDNQGNLKRSLPGKFLPFKELKRSALWIQKMDEKAYFICKSDDKKNGKQILLAEEINFSGLTTNGNIVKIDEIKTDEMDKKGDYKFSFSPNKKYLLIYKKIDTKKKEQEKYELSIFSNNFELKWKKEIEFPYQNKDFETDRFYINNEGEVIITARKWDNITKNSITLDEKLKEFKSDFFLFLVTETETALNEIKIDVDNKWINDLILGFNNKGEIIGAGFYSDKTIYGIKGSFFISIDKKNKKITHQYVKEFDSSILYGPLSEKQKEKMEKREESGKGRGLLKFEFSDLIMREDGSIIVVGEQLYGVEVCSQTQSGTTCRTVFHSDAIFVSKISVAGEIEWNKFIIKRQLGSSEEFFSHHLHVTKNNLYFLFNDNTNNFSLPQDELHNKNYSYSEGGGEIILVTMDMKGNMEREALYGRDENNLNLFTPKKAIQIDEKKSAIISNNNLKYRISLIEFKD